jgi:hypothetical protein
MIIEKNDFLPYLLPYLDITMQNILIMEGFYC